MNNNTFVAYEYKNITVKRDSAAVYTDCLSNFGWMPVDEYEQNFPVAATNLAVVRTAVTTIDDTDMVSLKFKRDRRINGKPELNMLERKCVDALSSVGKLERKKNAYTMGISLGTGLIGTALLGIAAYGFILSNTVLGVIFSVLGIVGWGAGFFSYLKVGRKKSAQTEPIVQEQLDIAYGACEQAHALLA